MKITLLLLSVYVCLQLVSAGLTKTDTVELNQIDCNDAAECYNNDKSGNNCKPCTDKGNDKRETTNKNGKEAFDNTISKQVKEKVSRTLKLSKRSTDPNIENEKKGKEDDEGKLPSKEVEGKNDDSSNLKQEAENKNNASMERIEEKVPQHNVSSEEHKDGNSHENEHDKDGDSTHLEEEDHSSEKSIEGGMDRYYDNSHGEEYGKGIDDTDLESDNQSDKSEEYWGHYHVNSYFNKDSDERDHPFDKTSEEHRDRHRGNQHQHDRDNKHSKGKSHPSDKSSEEQKDDLGHIRFTEQTKCTRNMKGYIPLLDLLLSKAKGFLDMLDLKEGGKDIGNIKHGKKPISFINRKNGNDQRIMFDVKDRALDIEDLENVEKKIPTVDSSLKENVNVTKNLPQRSFREHKRDDKGTGNILGLNGGPSTEDSREILKQNPEEHDNTEHEKSRRLLQVTNENDDRGLEHGGETEGGEQNRNGTTSSENRTDLRNGEWLRSLP